MLLVRIFIWRRGWYTYLAHCIDPRWFPIQQWGCYLLQPIIVSRCFSLILQVLIRQEANWIGYSGCPHPLHYIDIPSHDGACRLLLSLPWLWLVAQQVSIWYTHISVHGGYGSLASYLHQVLVYACRPIADLPMKHMLTCCQLAGTRANAAYSLLSDDRIGGADGNIKGYCHACEI